MKSGQSRTDRGRRCGSGATRRRDRGAGRRATARGAPGGQRTTDTPSAAVRSPPTRGRNSRSATRRAPPTTAPPLAGRGRRSGSVKLGGEIGAQLGERLSGAHAHPPSDPPLAGAFPAAVPPRPRSHGGLPLVAAAGAAPPHPPARGGRHCVRVEVAVAGRVQLCGEIGPQDRERPPALNAVAGAAVAAGPPLGRKVGG